MHNISSCPVCGSKSFKDFIVCKDFTVSHESFNIVQCQGCNFKFTNPIPNKNDLGKYYHSEAYISHSDTRKGLVAKLYHLVRNYTIKGKIKLISKYAKEKTLLDYGCGTGVFLNQCKAMGWQVYGLEPDKSARKIASESGASISDSLESLALNLDKTKLDVITLWHVLEHIVDLNETIDFLSNSLKSDGTVIVAVPNYLSQDARYYGQHWAAYDVPRHLYHFDPNTISQLFSKHNLTVIETLPMKFDSYYVSMLSEKYKTGKANYFSAFTRGLLSNLAANSSGNYSSLIYVLKRK